MAEPASLPLLDPTPMAELWAASPTRAAKLMGYYLEDLPTQVQGITAALQNGEAQQVGSIAHSLKSSSRQMGALQLGEVAYQVEQAARSTPPSPYLPQYVESLLGLVQPTVEAVNQQLKNHN